MKQSINIRSEQLMQDIIASINNSNGSMKGGSGDYTWSIATDGKATFNHINPW